MPHRDDIALMAHLMRRAGFGASREELEAYVAKALWRRGERKAGLTRKTGRGWHSLRRKFASEMMHKPLRVVCDLGGWKDAETVLRCYQQPDEEALRAALMDRRTP